jgi:hypothetical protein
MTEASPRYHVCRQQRIQLQIGVTHAGPVGLDLAEQVSQGVAGGLEAQVPPHANAPLKRRGDDGEFKTEDGDPL